MLEVRGQRPAFLPLDFDHANDSLDTHRPIRLTVGIEDDAHVGIGRIERDPEPACQIYILIGDADSRDLASGTGLSRREDAPDALRRQGAEYPVEAHDQKSGRLHHGRGRDMMATQTHDCVTVLPPSLRPGRREVLSFPCGRLLSDPAFQLLDQRPLFNRLGDIRTRADVQRHLAVFVTGTRRHDDNRRLLRLRSAA